MGRFWGNTIAQSFVRPVGKIRDRFTGGFPYSEGIFDDISKFTYAQLYWSPNRTIEDILKEYIAGEFAPGAVNDVLKIIATLEQNHHMRWWPGELEGVKLIMNWFPSKNAKPQADPGAEEAYALVRQANARFPEGHFCIFSKEAVKDGLWDISLWKSAQI